MEREPQSPEQRHKAMVQAYAISFYEFMDQFPRVINKSWGEFGQYVEWFSSDSLVQVHEIEGDYSVFVNSGSVEVVSYEITRGYAEYAEALIIDTEEHCRPACWPMTVDDWQNLHSHIDQYDAWAQSWPPQQLTD